MFAPLIRAAHFSISLWINFLEIFGRPALGATKMEHELFQALLGRWSAHRSNSSIVKL
jgi:predicted secreted hydrolase